MKIVKPINVTDDVLIDSSIPMPDVANGEREWQEESEKRVAFTYQSSGLSIVDSVYIDGIGIISVAKKTNGNYVYVKFDLTGEVVAESDIYTDPASEAVQITGLSSHYSAVAEQEVITCHIAEYRPDLDNIVPDPEKRWRFRRIQIRSDFSSTAGVNLLGGAVDRYRDKPIHSIFRMQRRELLGAGEDVCIFYSDDEPREIAIINPRNGLKVEQTSFLDFCFVGSDIYAVSQPSISDDGSAMLSVTRLDSSLKSINEFIFNFHGEIDDTLLINNSSGYVLVSSSQYSGSFTSEIYDIEMINIGSYRRDDEVIKSSTKRKYRCAVDATFDDPELGVSISPPTWVDIGAVNRWMPFDKQPSQQAVSNDPMYYKLKPGEFVRTLSIFNISLVASINVKVTDPFDGVIYDKHFDLIDNLNVVDMWTYLTLPILSKKELIITDLVCFRDSEIEITLTGESPSIGAILVGNESPAGRCVTGTGVRSNQFSIRKENGFGGFDIIKRGVGKIVRFRVAYDISQIDYLTNLLESIDSVYCVFIGDLPNGKTISVYGVLDPYQSDFETPTVNTLEFDVLGVL